jgi:hypothetical protein
LLEIYGIHDIVKLPAARGCRGFSDNDRQAVGEQYEALAVATPREALVGTPSPNFLPTYTARALHRYMSVVWSVEDPRVALLVDQTLRPRRNLVIGRKRTDFTSETELDDGLKRLFWFLPRYRSIILMPEDWSVEDMARQAEPRRLLSSVLALAGRDRALAARKMGLTELISA